MIWALTAESLHMLLPLPNIHLFIFFGKVNSYLPYVILTQISSPPKNLP